MVQKSVTYDCKLYCERVKKKKREKLKRSQMRQSLNLKRCYNEYLRGCPMEV